MINPLFVPLECVGEFFTEFDIACMIKCLEFTGCFESMLCSLFEELL